jgi:hypothetical protein
VTLFLGVKWPGREADHSLPSSAEVKKWVELYLHSPTTPSWCGAWLKHRDNFTFTLTFTNALLSFEVTIKADISEILPLIVHIFKWLLPTGTKQYAACVPKTAAAMLYLFSDHCFSHVICCLFSDVVAVVSNIWPSKR